LATPPSFSFLRTIYSHGWFDLPPFHWDVETESLSRVLETSSGRALLVTMREPAPGAVTVRVHPAPGDGSRREAAAIRAQVRHMLRLDEAFDPFHDACRRIEGFGWAVEAGAGPLLRAPDPYEDLVKMICTTNCTWALTRVMVGGIVARLGEPVADARRPSRARPGAAGTGRADPQAAAARPLRSFPTAEAMAAAPLSFYARVAKAGYRSGYLKTLAERVASADLVPSRWLDPEMPVPEIRREITSVKGAGRYVADNLLKLLGRYEGLGIDAWCRRKFAELHGRGRRVSDRSIERFYAPFGRWRGLALWCDLTRDWFEDGLPVELRPRRKS